MAVVDTTGGLYSGYQVIGFGDASNPNLDDIVYANNSLLSCTFISVQLTQSLYVPVDDTVTYSL
jgi:hypothetical protein